MARILLQTTNAYGGGDWNVACFSKIERLLRDDGHDVVARDREPDGSGSDAVLAGLGESEFHQLWLIAVDSGDGLAPSDVRGILRFRERGGGILTARDDQNRGASLLNLGSIGAVNNFARYNRERVTRRFSRNSGANGEYYRVVVMDPPHEILTSSRAPGGIIEFFPAHRHEGTLTIPARADRARAIATAVSCTSGREFNVAIAIDGEPSSGGRHSGRAICLSTFHQLADEDWNQIECNGGSEQIEIFGDYLRNAGRWLSPVKVRPRADPARA